MTGILIDNVDVTIENNYIAVGDINAQIVEIVLNACRGEFKESPTLGGEAIRMLGGEEDPMWCTIVKKQLNSIGVPIEHLAMIGDEITVKIQRNESNS